MLMPAPQLMSYFLDFSSYFFLWYCNSYFVHQLSAQLNPGCPATICENVFEDEKITLVHVQADGENDTLHYVWGLSRHRQPTVLVAVCERNTNVTITYNETLKDADNVQFSTKPKYTMSFVLTKVSVYFFVIVHMRFDAIISCAPLHCDTK